MLGGKQGVSDGWGECCFIQDGQGNVVTSKQRPKGIEGKSPTDLEERALQEEEAACAKVLGWIHP